MTFTLLGLFLSALFFLILIAFATPSARALKRLQSEAVSEIYAADGVLIGRYYNQYRMLVPYDSIPLDIINALVREGAKVRAFDPQAMDKARKVLPDIVYCTRAEEVADEADLLAVVTEWPEFGKLDLVDLKRRMRLPIICDGRNLFERSEVEKLGFTYVGIGR